MRTIYNGDANGPVVTVASDTSSARFYAPDQVGTAQMEVSAAGLPLWKGEFAPFGQELDQNPTANRYKFTGKERDAESGLDYFGARYYGSSMGRFMSPDWASKPESVPYSDLADPQSLNLYGYVRNNPMSKNDADGHQCNVCQQVWNWLTTPHQASTSASSTASQATQRSGALSVTAQVGTASASASGTYTHTAYGAGGKASAAVASATINEGSHSTTQIDGLVAKANASAGLSVGGKTGYGVNASAGAGAYVLSASQTETVTVGSVTVTASATGNEGVGANGSFSLGSTGIAGSFGTALGFGGSVSLSVNWKGASVTGGITSNIDTNGTRNTINIPELKPQKQ